MRRSLGLPEISDFLEVDKGSISPCRLKVTDPGLDGFDDWNLQRKLFRFLIRARNTGLDQTYIHGCPAPLLVTARAFESTSRPLVMARAADSASAFCVDVCTLPVSFTSPL